jgi:predicted transglutaminase-like cysteine proteinase
MIRLFYIFFIIFVSNSQLFAKDIYTLDQKFLIQTKKQFGIQAENKMIELVKLLNQLSSKSELVQLKAINDFFNEVKFEPDIKVWDKKDYWASREEFLDREEGDCEDYVIAKYFSLRQLGISDEKIFLTYVKAIKYKQSHMVLTYFSSKNATPLVLDNIIHTILPSTKRKDLRPLFSFNGEKIYMAKRRGLGKEVPKGKVNLTKWTNLILKIKREKI